MKRALVLMAMLTAGAVASGCGSTTAARDGASAASALAPAAAASGGVAERQIEARIIGAMNGGLIGGPLGRSLDQQDRRRALEAEYRALEYTPNGKAVAWKNASSGRSGEVVAAQPYSVGSQNCRQYSHTVFYGQEPQVVRGTACRNGDGSWTPLT